MISKELLRQRLAFIRQGSEVERFHTKRMIQRNDVGHHSYHVAWLAYLLALGMPNTTNFSQQRVVMAALAHDLAEHITGDMPGDFKREAGIREQFSDYERARFLEVGLEFEGGLNADEKRCLKLADMLEGAFFCISEASLGNGRIGLVFRNFRAYIEQFAPFNETEAAIVEYIDELWNHYGVSDAPGWNKTAHTVETLKDEIIMGELTEPQSESITYPRPQSESITYEGKGPVEELRDSVDNSYRSPLIEALVAEEREGRATPGPQSNAPIQGVTGAPSNPVDDTSDDRASQDLTTGPLSAPANARQHGGDHYKGVGYEHWDLVLDTGMNYFQGCATKYVTRSRKHNGGCRLNILKAIHYVDKLEEAMLADRITLNCLHSADDIFTFRAANQLTELETQVITDIISGRLGQARAGLREILEGCPQQSE